MSIIIAADGSDAMRRYEFQAMRTATKDLPEGSEDWVENMTSRLQYTFDHAETYGINPLLKTLRSLQPHKPWNMIPKGNPSKRADVYYERVTGHPWSVIVSMVKEFDRELATEIQSYVNPGQGSRGDEHSDNVTKLDRGNSASYTLNRLRRENPELFEQVKAGKLTANAAAIQAGFRKPMKTIPVDTPGNAIRALEKVFTREELREALGNDE